MNATSARSAPTTAKRTVSRGRLPNTTYRVREYLTEKEVERLIKAAGNNRWGHRDATMILIAYRHGLRASELCAGCSYARDNAASCLYRRPGWPACSRSRAGACQGCLPLCCASRLQLGDLLASSDEQG